MSYCKGMNAERRPICGHFNIHKIKAHNSNAVSQYLLNAYKIEVLLHVYLKSFKPHSSLGARLLLFPHFSEE